MNIVKDGLKAQSSDFEEEGSSDDDTRTANTANSKPQKKQRAQWKKDKDVLKPLNKSPSVEKHYQDRDGHGMSSDSDDSDEIGREVNASPVLKKGNKLFN